VLFLDIASRTAELLCSFYTPEQWINSRALRFVWWWSLSWGINEHLLCIFYVCWHI